MKTKSVVKTIFIFIWMLVGWQVSGQVRFVASAKGSVSVGEQFRLTYEVNAQGDNLKVPPFKDFSTIAGPSQSSSSSISIINGRTTQSITVGYTYVLQATKEGKFTIPSASIRVDGKVYESNPVTVMVVKGNASNAGTSGTGKQQSGNQSSGQSGGGGNDIFIKAYASKTNPYQGEDIVVTYKLYTKVDITQYAINKTPTNAGFWSQSLMAKNAQPKQTTEIINGERYIVAEIQKLALTPQRSGALKLEGLELECVARIKTTRRMSDDFFDNFFGGFETYQNVKRTVKSEPLTIQVKALPQAGKPIDFSGAVGNYTMTSKIDRTKLKANEAISLKYTISGKGNLNLLEQPKPVFPPDFETYDPKIIDNISTTESGNAGKRTYEFVMIPRTAGTFTIPAYTFSYFNPATGKYATITSEDYTIDVAKGDGSAPAVVGGTSNQEDIKMLSNDIRYIKVNDLHVFPKQPLFYRSDFFWILLLLPLLILVAVAVIWRKELQKRSNVALMKNRKATRIARKRLKTAQKAMQENNSSVFFEEISKAIWGYLADKMNIAMADLSTDTIRLQLTNQEIDDILTERIVNLLADCEFARFAPGAAGGTEQTYAQAIAIIEELENKLK